MYGRSIKKPTSNNIETYKKYRNRLRYVLRLAKQSYYSDLFKRERNNMKNTWKVLNSIIRSKTRTCCEKFVSNDLVFSCPTQIATEFNNYFSKIGPSLASTIQHSGKDFNFYLDNPNNATCFFKPTDTEEILKIISKLGSGKSAGHDGIQPILLRKLLMK